MFQELVTAVPKTLREVLRFANMTYRSFMLTILSIFFGYISLMWGLSAFAGSGAITLAMWGFIFAFTFIYWQPLLGQLGALVEWRVRGDDPNMKSTWRLYLMVLIAAIVVGEIAITLHLLGSKQLFPLVALVPFTYVLYALLTPGNDLDKYLKWIAGILFALALMGTYHELNPPTASQKLAREIGKKDINHQDLLFQSQLNTYVNPLLECNASKDQMATWEAGQITAYNTRCSASNHVRIISLAELQEYWPKEHKIWLDSQKGLVAGGKAILPTGKWWEQLSEKELILGLTLVHIIPLLFIPIILGTLSYKLIKVKTDKDGKKVETDAITGKYNGVMWLMLIAIIGYGGYYYWDSPIVAKMLGNDGSRVQTTTTFNPSLSALEVNKWKAQYSSKNFHIKMPHDVWHGQFIEIREGSYVADNMNFVLFDRNDQSLAISYSGNCVAGTKYVRKVCDGYWNAGHGMTGVFRLVWDDPHGRTFLIKMYAEQYFRTDSSVAPIKEIRVLDRVTG